MTLRDMFEVYYLRSLCLTRAPCVVLVLQKEFYVFQGVYNLYKQRKYVPRLNQIERECF